ncbi:FUSC family protein [Beijerinckia sp. L45]|uniref:FUSC family protein n=1 Tax=Beijerinckia sp. L45 TaxID=1641855 RepID=UPI00131BCE2E|nr:FUSC family protein [Beijerinckia sp. L45]
MSSVQDAGAASGGLFTLAGLPLTSWSYAFRIWFAMVIALGAAFWLQLDSPSSAAITVAILAQPRRGQAFQKAGYRVLATIVGVVASIVITALFSQTRDLFLLATAAWLALCVYVASYYDGNRAYGAVLSGYTVSLVAVIQIDAPQNVFIAGLSRGAAVTVGIAAIALVNDVFAAPDVFSGLRVRLAVAHGRVNEMVDALLRGDEPGPDRAADLLGTITGARLDIQTLPSERAGGGGQAAAARSSAVAMVGRVAIARSFSDLSRLVSENVDPLRALVWNDAVVDLEAGLDAELARPDRAPEGIAIRRFALDLADLRRLASRELANMEEGLAPERDVRLPIHRDRQTAWRTALRVFITVLASSTVLILSSWPTTSLTLSLVGVVAALSATTPNPGAFAKGALIAMPVSVAAGGITEFLILDGVDSFPLLGLAMVPTIFAACFLSLSPKAPVAGLGSLLLVFFPFILSPANPQSYNPQTYVLTGLLALLAVCALFVALYTILPTTDRDRRRWMIDEARGDLRAALDGTARLTPTQAAYLTADRIVQLSRLRVGFASAKRWRLRHMLLLSTLTIVATRAGDALNDLGMAGFPSAPIAAARTALARLDAAALHDAAAAVLGSAPLEPCVTRSRAARAVADLFFLSVTAKAQASQLRHTRSGVPA